MARHPTLRRRRICHSGTKVLRRHGTILRNQVPDATSDAPTVRKGGVLNLAADTSDNEIAESGLHRLKKLFDWSPSLPVANNGPFVTVRARQEKQESPLTVTVHNRRINHRTCVSF